MNPKIFFVVLSGLLCLAAPLFAQESVPIEGHVVIPVEKQPLEGVVVKRTAVHNQGDSAAQEYPFDGQYTQESAVKKIADGGVALISKYGDLLFDKLTFIPFPEYDDPSDTSLKGLHREDYPVAKLLIQGGATTVGILEHTDFFQIQIPDNDLEVMSYVLGEILGSEKAIEFASSKKQSDNASEQQNWQRIEDILKDPQKQHRLLFSFTEAKDGQRKEQIATIRDYAKRRQAWRESQNGGNPLDKIKREDYLRYIVSQLNHYKEKYNSHPENLFKLTSSGVSKEEGLFYRTDDGSLVVATYNPNSLHKQNAPAAILSIPSENGMQIISATSDGVVSTKSISK
ncbi:hypothetical protein KBB96_09600 [Luteolibacter ambystomatis]|uniref:Uncharacterized protein n=1 Tax=Luteolibacter ambystomatis TaxID=2824561 RepID=A0A975J353_9BACT|nr:hypothetical protein [Luteolibacter ambystomatis]QUE53134.1 hypothetical protein KBB96_09600 [Luteolibacter ambystomatis]